MKIVSLLGSPRTKGSSSTLAAIVAEHIDNNGKEHICHDLNKLNYRGYQGCMADEVKHRWPSRKKLVFIQTQGAPASMYGDVFDRYNSFFTLLDFFTETHLIRGCELSTETDVREIDALVSEAKEVERKL